MRAVLDRLRRRIGGTTLPQAIRQLEQAARVRGAADGVGEDTPPLDEPVHLVASDRMLLPTGDLAGIDEPEKGPVRLTANVMGLAGATPALPPYYSEIQLQRRRLRDRSFGNFLNLFDHRALSFFYRVFAKYNWLIGFERAGRARLDPVSNALLAFAGLPTEAMRRRLPIDDGALVPLAGRLGDIRRSAATLQTVLRHLTGLPLRVVQAEPTWMDVPADQQSRLGRPGFGQFAQLGGDGLEGAMLGAAVLDAQHHFSVEIGPLDYPALLDFCGDGRQLRLVRELCHLVAGIEYRPVVRLGIARRDVPPLRLGAPETPAVLGRTSWLGALGASDEVMLDCVIPIGVGSEAGLAA